MPERTHERKLREDPPESPGVINVATSIADENTCLSEQNFEETSINLKTLG